MAGLVCCVIAVTRLKSQRTACRRKAPGSLDEIITSRGGGPRFDFVSRFFAPAIGVDEGPVCGSAHCCLAPYWHARLGKARMVGHQASARGAGG